jgi:hypothetical protein
MCAAIPSSPVNTVHRSVVPLLKRIQKRRMGLPPECRHHSGSTTLKILLKFNLLDVPQGMPAESTRGFASARAVTLPRVRVDRGGWVQVFEERSPGV